MNVNPGELNKKIEIAIINTQDGVKTTIRNCWSAITNTSGTDIRKGNIELESARTRFLVRFTNTEITNDMVIIYKSRVYNIVYANNYSESNEYIEILGEFKGVTYEN